MKIKVFNQYGRLPFAYRTILKKIEADVSNHFNEARELSLILVTNDEIQSINRTYRKLDRVTDVISFEEDTEGYMGEVFIAINQLVVQAKQYGHSNVREFAFLLVHGILHLLGYDHLEPVDEKVMVALQEEILNRCGYKRG